MKGRARLAVLLVFLLPIPLIWASSRLLLGGLNVSAAREEGSRFVPLLPPDETRRLLTFEKSCEGDEDCETPLVCLRQFMCVAAHVS